MKLRSNYTTLLCEGLCYDVNGALTYFSNNFI